LPFLDNDLVDYALKCHSSLKFDNLSLFKINENIALNKKNYYMKRYNNGKTILRDLARKYIYGNTYKLDKQGFSTPDSNWHKSNTPLEINAIMQNKKSPIFQVLDPKLLNHEVDKHFQNKENKRLLIWSIISMNQALKLML